MKADEPVDDPATAFAKVRELTRKLVNVPKSGVLEQEQHYRDEREGKPKPGRKPKHKPD